MRLLLVSHFFPPFNNMGAVRVGKTAKYLMKLGHDIRVISAEPQPFQATLPVEIPSQHVIYTRWLNVNRPAELVSGGRARVAAKGHDVGGLRGALNKLRPLYRHAYKSVVAFPDDQIGWLPFAIRASSRLIHAWKPDMVLASGPPNTSFLVAHAVSTRHRIPWVADLRDLWTDSHYYPFPSWRRRLEDRLERRTLSSSVGMITVSEPLADVLRAKYTQPVMVVLNGYDADDYRNVALASPDDRLHITYTGMLMWTGMAGGMDPSPLFRAMAKLGRLAEHIRVRFYGRRLEDVRGMVKASGIDHLVEIHDQVPYRDALGLQQAADILLLLLWNNVKERGVYTGKLFEYIGARRPILAIGSSAGVAAELICSRGAGRVLTNIDEIADQLAEWIRQKRVNGGIPSPPAAATTGLTRQEQTSHLETFLHALIKV